MKIDIHAHLLPESWPNLKEKYGYGGFIYLDHHKQGSARMMRDDGKFFREIQENCWNPAAILPEMDAHNVDVMVLCTVPVLFNYWAQPEDGLDWSQFLNNHLAEVISPYPKRFVGLGTLPMQHPEFAAQELRRLRNELNLPGVQIGSNINDINLDDPQFDVIWETAVETNACIMVHPWNMMGFDQIEKYWLPWLVSMPAETSRAICSMMFGGVFDRFPDLRVLFAHGGGSFPHTLGRISHGWHCRPDLVNLNNVKDPREYAGKFWVDGITHDQDALRYTMSVVGANRIAYGTDYPFPLGDLEHGKFIEQMDDLSASTKEQLFADSALEFLGLKKEMFE